MPSPSYDTNPHSSAPSSTNGMDIQKMIEIASQMKAAQPDTIQRRARIDSIPFTPKDQEMRQSHDIIARQQYAEQVKAEGNERYRGKAYHEASILYQRAYGIFRYSERIKTKEGDDIKVTDTIESLSPSSSSPIYLLLLSLLVNMAACHVFLEDWESVLVACHAALEIPCENVALRTKAHYRCGLAYQAQEEWKQAITSFTAALQLTPSDSAIRQHLDQVRQQHRIQTEKDKKTFTGMFDRGQIYDGVPDKAPVKPKNDIPILPTSSSSTSTSTSTSSSTNIDPFLQEYTQRSFQHPTLDHARQQRLEMRRRKREVALRALEEEDSDDDSAPPRSSKRDRRAAIEAEAAHDEIEEQQTQIQHMREAATKFGLDLSDPLIQKELARLQQQQMEKEGVMKPNINQQIQTSVKSKSKSSSLFFFTIQTWMFIVVSLLIYFAFRFRWFTKLSSMLT